MPVSPKELSQKHAVLQIGGAFGREGAQPPPVLIPFRTESLLIFTGSLCGRGRGEYVSANDRNRSAFERPQGTCCAFSIMEVSPTCRGPLFMYFSRRLARSGSICGKLKNPVKDAP